MKFSGKPVGASFCFDVFFSSILMLCCAFIQGEMTTRERHF
jgi:hypothetical protein